MGDLFQIKTPITFIIKNANQDKLVHNLTKIFYLLRCLY